MKRIASKGALFLAGLIVFGTVTGCAPSRKPIPLGAVPVPPMVKSADEQYGQQVLGELSREFNLSRDDAQRDRVEQLVTRLADAAGSTIHDPWHITVFEAPEVRNAAATRGNFLFVWSGLLDYLRSDDELAVVLAHELGHILANHTMPDPAEAMNRALTQGVGSVTSNIVGSSVRSAGGITGQLAGSLAELALGALIVNPNERRLETEADEIGVFLMARAGYDPAAAVQFWERVKNDPEFGAGGSGALAFLSSHPSNQARFERLQQVTPLAEAQRLIAYQVRPSIKKSEVPIYENPSRNAPVIGSLPRSSYFFADNGEPGWACNPQGRGCVLLTDLVPIP